MKDIIGFEGLYAVTSCARVWSYKSQRFLKPYKVGKGYWAVDLRKDGVRNQRKVHRLVALAYIAQLGTLTVLKFICFFQICAGKAKEAAIIRSLKFLR